MAPNGACAGPKDTQGRDFEFGAYVLGIRSQARLARTRLRRGPQYHFRNPLRGWPTGKARRTGQRLLALGVDLMASSTTQAIEAIRNLNATIPIVMTATSDPIGSGLIDNLSRPGNTTGVTLLSSDVAGKRIELLKEVAPHVSRIAVLAYKNHPPTALMFKETQAAARALQIEVQLLEVDAVDIENAFEATRKANAQAMVVQQSVAFVTHIPRIAELAAKYHLPSVHEIRAYPVAGGLMSYGTNIREFGISRCHFCRQDSKRNQGERSSGRTTDPVRVGHQSQGCQSP